MNNHGKICDYMTFYSQKNWLPIGLSMAFWYILRFGWFFFLMVPHLSAFFPTGLPTFALLCLCSPPPSPKASSYSILTPPFLGSKLESHLSYPIKVVWICISLTGESLKHYLKYWLTIGISSFEHYLCRSSSHLLLGSFVSLVFNFFQFFLYSRYQPLSETWLPQNVSNFVYLVCNGLAGCCMGGGVAMHKFFYYYYFT